MSVDIVNQLARYGDLLRDELASAPERDGTTVLTTAIDPGGAWSGSDDRPGPEARPGPGNRRGGHRILLVAAVLAIVAGIGSVALANRPRETVLVATPVTDPATIERRPHDPAAFLARLDDVDFELEMRPGRAPTAVERAAIVEFFDPTGTVDPATATIGYRLADGWVVLQADVSGPTLETDGADPSGTTPLRCTALAKVVDSGLRFEGRSSCRDPSVPTTAGPGHSTAWAYGCLPAVDIAGLIQFGKTDFTAEVAMAPGSPGVLFTLPDGDTVLVRPLDDQVIFAGPIVDRMEIFSPDGDSERISTVDCR